MFSASSRQRQIYNGDGSINVYCGQCGEFIAKTYLKIGTATCELCRRILAGEILTPEQVRDYKLAKGSKADVSMLLLPEEPVGVKFTLRSLGGDLAEALGFKKKEPPVIAEKSVAVSKGKARGRLLESVDLEASMSEVDRMLKDNQNASS